jgi:hypothetical protein
MHPAPFQRPRQVANLSQQACLSVAWEVGGSRPRGHCCSTLPPLQPPEYDRYSFHYSLDYRERPSREGVELPISSTREAQGRPQTPKKTRQKTARRPHVPRRSRITTHTAPCYWSAIYCAVVGTAALPWVQSYTVYPYGPAADSSLGST